MIKIQDIQPADILPEGLRDDVSALGIAYVPPQPETPDTGTNTDADPLLKAQAEKNRVITESAR